MSDTKDIAAHLSHCADVRGAQRGPGAGNVMDAESTIYGMATLTVADLRAAIAEIRRPLCRQRGTGGGAERVRGRSGGGCRSGMAPPVAEIA